MMTPRPLHVLVLTTVLISVAFGRDGNLVSVTSPARLPGDGAALPDKGRREVTPTVILGRTGVPVEVTHEVTDSTLDGVLAISAGDGTTARFRVTTSDLSPDGVTAGPGWCQALPEEEEAPDGTTGAPFTQSGTSGQEEALGGDPKVGATSYPPMTSPESATRREDVTSSGYSVKCTHGRTHTAFTLQHTYLHPGRYDLLARFQDTHAPSYWEVVAEVVVKELLEITLGPAKVLALGDEGAAAHAHISLTPISNTRLPPTDHEHFTATHMSTPTLAHEAFTPPGRTSGGSPAAGPTAPTPMPQPLLAPGPPPAHAPQLCPGGDLSWAWNFGDDTDPDTKMDSRRREMETHGDLLVMKEGGDKMLAGIIKTEGRESGRGRDGRGRQERLITGGNGIGEDRRENEDGGGKTYASWEELKERESMEKTRAKKAPPETEADNTASSTSSSSSSSTSSSTSTSSSNTHGPDTSSSNTSSATVHHVYHKPGLYNFSAQVLCDGRPLSRKHVAGAFLVAVPVRGVQISVAERDAVLPLLPRRLREDQTRNVSINISVAEGSHLDPLALELEEGVELFSKPDVDAQNGGWVAQFLCTWRRPGRYRPRVRVSNALGSETVSLHTSILVQSIPQTVVLRGVVAEVGQEVLFRARSNGTDVHYDWSLPGGEFLRDAGPEVRRVYNSSFTDIVNVTAYNEALASLGRHQYPQAEAMAVVQHRLTAVAMSVEGSVGPDGRVIIQMGKLTSLTATVTPPEAVHNVTFYWYIDSKRTISRSPSFSFSFEWKGERELSVRAENRVSSVKSAAPVQVLVVERISGLRGVAFQDSVHAGSSRTYTVQVDHGSNITYTWDFGDGSEPLVTASDAADHVYNQTGAYDLSVNLTTPLQDHAVAATTVFVLQSGVCDTPKVYGFFPKDQTEYDGTQEILLEPEIHRNCSAGGGPEYRWRVLDEDGQEALFTNYHAFFSPTLIIHPFYDSHWTKLLAPAVEKASAFGASDLVSLQAHSISPFAVLADGTYTAELTIAENDTIVRAAANASFSVVAIRLKVVFTDGSAREVDARSNITLQVEVTSPTPDYDIKWGCHLLYNASEGCFPEDDPWSKYTNTSDHADTVYDILHRWWEMIHGGGDRGAGDGRPVDAAPSGGGPRRRGGRGGEPGGARVSPDPGVIRRYYRFQQTITFPASDLRLDPADPSARRFLFNVTVSYLLRQATAEQLITVAFGRDNFGIRINLSSQIPFGAYRRLVFQSECRTCTAEELQDMKYKWNLQMMTSSSFFASSRPPPVAEEEDIIWEALRQGRPPDTFLPRPRDYLRVYNKTDLLLPRDKARGSRPLAASFPRPEAEEISASDLKKFPVPLSNDLLARARRILREDGSVDRALWRTLRLELRSEVWKDPAWKPSEEGRRKRDAQIGEGHEFSGGRHAPKPPAAQQDLVQKSRSRRAVYPTEQERRRAEVFPVVDSEEGKGARLAKSVGDSSPQYAPLHPRQITTRQPLPLDDEGQGGQKPSVGHESRPGMRGGGDRGRDGNDELEVRDYDALAGGGMHAWPRGRAEAAPGTGGRTAGGARTKLEFLPEESAGGGERNELFVEEEGHEAGEDAGGGGGASTERINGREHQGRDELDTGSTRRRKNLFETNLVRDESEVRVRSLSSASPDDDDEGENASGNSGPKETTGAAVTPDAVTSGGVTPSVTQVRRKAPGESVVGSVTPHDMGQTSVVDAADTKQEETEAAVDPREPSGTPWRAGAEGGGSTGGGEDPRRVVVGAGRGEGLGRRLRSSPASPSPRDETAEHHARGASPTPALSPSNAPDADVGRSGTASTSTGASATVSGATPQNKHGPPTAPLAPPSDPPPPLPAVLSLARPGDAERISPSINEHSSKEDEWTRPLSPDPPRRNAVNREEREKKGGEKLDEGEGEGQRKRAERGDKDGPKAKGSKERGGGEQGANKTRKRKRRGREPATPSGWGRGQGAASEGGGRGARDDGHDGPADADVGREARRPHQPAHPGHDSAHLPIRLPAPRPSPPARRAPAQPADTATAGSRPVSTPGKRWGARDGGGGAGRRPPTPLQRAVGQDSQRGRGAGGDAGDAPEPREGLRPPQRSPAKGEPVSVYPPMSWLSGLSAGRGVPQDAPPASYPPLPTSSPSTPQVLDYQKYLQMKHRRAQSPEHRMAPFATTSEPDQRARDSRWKHAWWGGGGGDQGREAGEAPPDAGGWDGTPTPREGDAVASPLSPPRETRWKSATRGGGGRGGRNRGERRGRGKGRDQDTLPTDTRQTAATSAPGRSDPEQPPAWAKGGVAEGPWPSPREDDYQGRLKEYAEETGLVPDLNCRPERWRECALRPSSRNRTLGILEDTLGKAGEDHIMRNEERSLESHILDDFRFTNVVWLTSMTSTGTREPLLVLYVNMLYSGLPYKLSLHTQNPRTNYSGSAQQLIDFSPAPVLKSCKVVASKGGPRFWASCEVVSGLYRPLYVQWSYHFLRYGPKTLFYHGTRTSFDFTLPSGLAPNGHKMYVSVKAVDGKGVASKYQEVTSGLQVEPRFESGDGVLSLFKEISRLENESPPLLLQEVRSLAWELNLLDTTHVSQTVFDNIVALLFYQTRCKDSLETATDESVAAADDSDASILAKVNLLKSCARDHLVELVASLPIRDEMEVMQVLTALEMIVGATEYISSKTFTRVIEAMRAAEQKMWWNYNPEIRTQAAKEYFALTSEVLDKQTEIYDWASSSLLLSIELVELLLKVMEGEITARFLEEQPLGYSSSTLKYTGYLAETEHLNRWSSYVLFSFNTSGLPHRVHLVQSLEHDRSPYYVKDDPVVSKVVSVDLHMNRDIQKSVTVKLPRSNLVTESEYDFRRPGILSPQSLSVYEFEVKEEHAALAFHVLLQVVRVLNTDYPVAAVVLICQSLQSLREPLYKEELSATLEAAQVQLSLAPGLLSKGTKLLIIMDKNSYENNWSRQNVSVQGADFKVAAWWSQCLVWNAKSWSPENCSVEGNLSTWDLTTCSCHSTHSIFGARTVPILSEESTIAVNELMLVETFMALYFIVLVLVLYFVMALGLQTSERHRLKRRNIWLRDNDPRHEWAYLLTIKTGTQWNAGTTSKVYAIVHGTHGMSETRELQSKQTGQLFTRGALCTFILTTAEPLGDILKVQLWHDNSGGSSAGWYVCETSVVDLVLGARYAYPCYRWLAVQAEDAKVEREITLESPTTFFQDFEHFLPQYASEHMLWTSLLTTSSTAKFYRLQRLTICLIVCLCLGTISLAVVQRINTEHTMMVPDMHIEPMYYGCIIAMALLPVQWLLEMVFKMSNRLEEKEYNNKSVLDTLRATRESEAATQPRGDGDGESDAGLSDEESELYNPNSSTWTALARWAQTVELTNAHLSLLQDKDMDGMHVTQRSRTPNAAQSEGPPEEALGPADPAARCAEGKARPLPAAGGRDAAKKCSPTIFEFLAELRRAFACLVRILFEGRRAKCKGRARQEDEAGWEADEDEDEDDEGESGEGRAASSLTFIFSQCVGWIVCCFFAAMCCMVLVVRGSGMPMDYCAVWLHIIYMTLCFSMFVMQPLVVVIYTLYKVCMYRWLGCRGCISDCVTVPLDQVVAIWNRYQTVLRGYKNRTEDMSSEKLLEERQRTRDLRFAHPPSEDYLLRCREKEAQREKVSSVFRSVLGLLLMLALLVVIASNSNVSERYMLNASTLTTLANGSCLDREKYPDCCQDSSCKACSEGKNEDYMAFGSIVTKEDWWKWASSELISLAYNSDRAFSQFSVFCDSNSVLIGWPRLRKYDMNPEECEAAKYLVSSNRSLADLLHVQSCIPEYVDSVSHVFSFGSNRNTDWDAHFLAVNYGMFSQYSYTDHQQDLPSSRTFAVLLLIFLEASHWIDEKATRAVVTELTLYHPQTDLYTTVNLLAEFPSLSGAQVMVRVSSTAVERYKGTWSLVCIMAEVILVAVSMHYLYRTTIYVYKCRLKIWKSFWVFLDILMTILSWSYIVCLMLRVQIAEYIMWQLRVAYFQKYVNLKGLTTWDKTLESLIGGMLLVHMIRCMRMMRYLPVCRRLGHVLSGASKDVLVVTVMLLGLLVCCMLLGYMWFSSLLWEFHTVLEAFLTLVRIIMTHVPFLPNLENESNGYVTSLGYLYYLITYTLLYQLTRALYKAAFVHAMKSYVGKPGVDVAWRDIKVYAKERCQSVLRFIQRKAEVVDEPKDNTPPDFYMAELELQINQILGGLDNLAESLGIVTERVAQLDEDDDEDDDEEFRDSHDDGDDDDEEEEEQEPLCDRGRDWLAEGFLQGKVKSSTPKTELDVILQPLQKRVQELLDQAESGEREPPFPGASAADDRLAEAGSAQDSPFETSFNLDAFTDIASCQTEIEAITRSWNLSALPGDPAARSWAQDDGGQLAKFLKDVSVSAASDESLQAFGKYGKTVGKLKAMPRLQPSHESLAAALRSHSTSGTSDASRIRSVSSFVDSGGHQLEQAGGRPRSHTAAAAQEGQAHGSSVAMLGSKLRRTQTQGRGKGHVDVLDIESLILDSEEGSEY